MSTERDHYVYRYFDAGDNLLYVGCSKRPEVRYREHRHDRPSVFARIASVRMQGPYTYTKARDIERQAIRTEEPESNMTPLRCAQQRAARVASAKRVRELVEDGFDYIGALHQDMHERDGITPTRSLVGSQEVSA